MRLLRTAIVGCYGAALFVACGGQLPQDECEWIADPNNCLQRFAKDVGMQCGEPFQPNTDPVKSTTGAFQGRDKLDICVKAAGGQVIFDPPLKPAQFPLQTVTFKMLDNQANPCGNGAYNGPNDFSITIVPPANSTTVGGTFTSAASQDATNTFDVTCPGGTEVHHFNNLVLQKCGSPREQLFQPTAILDSSPGVPPTFTTTGQNGFVRFRVQYPPKLPANCADDVVACFQNAQPTVVEYFNCSIPAPPGICQDGVKNGDETDVDCGGSCATKLGLKCAVGMKCLVNGDCQSGKCVAVAGLNQCAM